MFCVELMPKKNTFEETKKPSTIYHILGVYAEVCFAYIQVNCNRPLKQRNK